VQNKADTIASLQAGDRHWGRAESDQFDVRIYGDTAVVIGRWRSKGGHGDEAFDYAARFLSVWVREAEQWRNVAYQSTEIAT